MLQDQTISEAVKKSNQIIDIVFSLPPHDRIVCLERLLFAFIDDPKKKLITLLYELNATQKQIAKALDVDQSLISRQYPKEEKK